MIQRKELTAVLVNVITAKMVLMFPKMLIINSGNSAWIQALYNCTVVFVIFLIISKLYKGRKNIIELADIYGGKPLKIITGMIVFIVFMLNYASIIRIFPETVKMVLLQDMRVEFITIIFEAVIAAGAYMGIQSIARVNYMIMPVIGVIFILFIVSLAPNYNTNNLFPFFGNGIKKIFINGFNTISMFSDLLLLNIFLPYYENSGEAEKSGRRAIIISSVIIITILTAYCFVYPYPVSGEFMIPVFQLARIIHLGTFFSRFEVIFQFAWSLLLLFYSSIYVYALCIVWQKSFSLKYYKPLIFPIVIISGVIALIPDSLPQLIQNEKTENIIVYPIAFLLPVIFGFLSKRYYTIDETTKS